MKEFRTYDGNGQNSNLGGMAIEKIRERQTQRLALLNLFYEAVDGRETVLAPMRPLGERLALDPELISELTRNLQGQGLLEIKANPMVCQLTHLGLETIEQARLQPTATPPGFNATSMQQAQTIIVNGGQVQFGIQSNLTQNIGITPTHLAQFLTDVRTALDSLPIEPTDDKAIRTQLDFIEDQQNRPNGSALIAGALRMVGQMLQNIAMTTTQSLAVQPLIHQLAVMGIH